MTVLYGKVVGERLSYLATFIIDRDFPAFAKSKNDVAWVLEYLDWNYMADRSIAKLYIAMKGLPDDVKTEGVIDNFNSLKFRQPWIDYLYQLDEKLADQALIELVDQSCEAYEYGLEIGKRGLVSLRQLKIRQVIKPALMGHTATPSA